MSSEQRRDDYKKDDKNFQNGNENVNINDNINENEIGMVEDEKNGLISKRKMLLLSKIRSLCKRLSRKKKI